MYIRPGQTQTSLLILFSWPLEYVLLPHQMPLPTLLIDPSSEPCVGRQILCAAPEEDGEERDRTPSAIPALA